MAEPPKHRIGYEDTLNLVTSLCLTYTLVVAGLRAWVRRGLNGMDDAVILLAVVLAIGLFASNYIALGDGAAKTRLWISEHGDIPGLSSTAMSGVVCFVLSLYVSKCAVICFMLRLTKASRQILIYRISMAFVAVVGLASVLLVTVAWPENSGYYWAFARNSASCSSQSSRWIAFTVLDIVTELLLVALPLYQVWDLQMPLKRKLIVIAAFNLRLPVIGLSIGRMVYTQRLCDSTTDFGLGSGLVIIWLTIETSFAIVSNTFAALRAFTMSFNSTFGLGFVANAGSESYTMFQYRGNKNSAAYASHIKRTASAPRSNVPADPRAFKTQPEDIGRSYTSVSANRVGQTRAEEWKRDRTMDDHGIMRETEYSVVMDDQDMVRHSETGGDEIPIVQGSRR